MAAEPQQDNNPNVVNDENEEEIQKMMEMLDLGIDERMLPLDLNNKEDIKKTPVFLVREKVIGPGPDIKGNIRDAIDENCRMNLELQIMDEKDYGFNTCSTIRPYLISKGLNVSNGSVARRVVKKKAMPKFDLWDIANSIDYREVYALETVPNWKKEMKRQYGPSGSQIEGYMDTSKSFLWKWNEKLLGRMTLNAEGTLKFDGINFYVRKKNAEGKFTNFSVALETWLTDRIRKKNPHLLNDTNWKYKHMWHEFIRMTQVRLSLTDIPK